jgi:hypothetical protein
LCSGCYITFQDADDTCSFNRLEKQLEAFTKDSELGLVGTWVQIISSEGKVQAEDKRPASYEEIMKSIYHRNPFCSATVMIKKEVYQTIGGYREQFDGYSYQDYDWTFLIAEKFKTINLPEFLYEYRQHQYSNSKAVSVKRRIGDKLVQHLARQRKEEGLDCLQAGDIERFNKLIEQLSIPYQKDKSLLYQETALALLYAGLPQKALQVMWKGVIKNPLRFRNYKTLKYALMENIKAIF